MDPTRKDFRTGLLIQVGGNTPESNSYLNPNYILKVCFSLSILKYKTKEMCSITESHIFTKGPTHSPEVSPSLHQPKAEHSQSPLRLAELTSGEEDDGLHGRISQYERKVDSLMTEVSSLKNEVSEEGGTTPASDLPFSLRPY